MFLKTRPTLATVGKRSLALAGQKVLYTIKRSGRARHVRLEVRPETGLTVVVPSTYELNALPGVLQKKAQWILQKLAKYTQIPPPADDKELKDSDSIPYLGSALKVVTRRGREDVSSVRLEANSLVVTLGPGVRAGLLLEQWYRIQASRLLRQRADELAPRLGVSFNRFLIRGQKTRWGSCSNKRNLSFNWKLILAPQPVIDYVVIHELAHLREMNHSKAFWQLVAQYCPDWQGRKQWLKDHEAELAVLPAF